MWSLCKKYLKQDILLIAADVALIVLQTAVQLFFLVGEMRSIITSGVQAGDMGFILRSGGKMLLWTLLIAACSLLTAFFSAKISGHMLYGLRRDCFRKTVSMSLEQISRFGESSLMIRTSLDPKNITNLVYQLPKNAMLAPIVIVCILVLVFRINLTLFFIMAFAFLAAVFAMLLPALKTRKPFAKLQRGTEHFNLLIRERIVGVRTVRAFGNEKKEEDRIRAAADELAVLSETAGGPMKFAAPAAMLILNWTIVIIYFVGLAKVRRSLVDVSDLLLVFQYLGYFTMALGLIPTMMTFIPKAVTSAERVCEILNVETDEDPAASGTARRRNVNPASVELRHVSFGYNGAKDAVSDICLKVPAGSTLGITGTTGAGKSTLLYLICGLFTPKKENG